MKRKKRFSRRFNKKGQEVMGMGFGMIFSIILIVFFIVIAFIVIKSFLDAQNCARIGIFVDKFKTDVKKTWNSQIDSHPFKGILPTKIKYVCFADLSLPSKGENQDIGYDLGLFEGRGTNMFFYPTGSACNIPSHNVPQLDIERIIRTNNPNCIEVVKGNVEIIVEKELTDKFVNVRS